MDGHLGNVSIDRVLQFARENIPKIPGHQDYKDHYLRAIDNYASGVDMQEFPLFFGLKRYPASLEEFMFSSELLNRPREELYPAVVDELIKINNPNNYRIVNPYTELLCTGGIGSAKTTTALYTTAYQLYVLSCFKDPHRTFGMDSTSEIMFIFQSMSAGLAQDVDYNRFREICEQSTYFRTQYPFDTRLKLYLKFPNRVEVKAVGTDTGTIGQNVIGGVIDELNFMAVIKGSKRASDNGVYNQASVIYNGVARRRKSRFMDCGSMPGILCLVSSKRYPGEFTDKKIEEAASDPTIYVYDKRVWDIKPKGTFNRGWFKVFSGDLTRKPRVIKEDEELKDPDDPLIVSVPSEFRSDFEDDVIGSLRDIAGVGTLSRYPFLMNVDKVSSCFGSVPSLFVHGETDFIKPRLGVSVSSITNRNYPRWVHIDLGVTNDACGLAIGHVHGFRNISDQATHVEMMPNIRIDGLLRIVPPKGDEILFYKVRNVLYLLRDKGVDIKWVSFDSFQSVDSIQILKQKGFVTGVQSMDKTNNPYELTKAAFYTGRLELPEHELCLTEFLSLERDNKTYKVDHPVGGSKDVADAVAGVVSGLTLRREIWSMFNVSPDSFYKRVKQLGGKDGNKDDAKE